MHREIIWQQIEGVGLEHLRLTADAAAIVADGMLLAIEDGKPLRAHYTIECDADWQVRQVELSVAGGTSEPPQFLALRACGDGHWESRMDSHVASPCELRVDAWAPRPDLDGCVDIDTYPSPFTNTLPIRRLRLAPGDAAQISVAFIKLPELTVQSVQQRYTHLHALNSLDAGELSDDGARYRYEGLDSGYVADLPVDAEGLVVEYPGWFRRVYP